MRRKLWQCPLPIPVVIAALCALVMASGSCRKNVSGRSGTIDFWASSPVIQPEADSLRADESVPPNQVFDPGLRLEFGAPNPGMTPATAYTANHFSFAMVWWWLLFENHGNSIAHIQVAMGYPPGFRRVPGQPVFGAIPFGEKAKLGGGQGFVPGNPPLLDIMSNKQFLLTGVGRTLDIQPVSSQYAEVLKIERHVGMRNAIGSGVFRAGCKCIPTVHFAIWCDSPAVVLKAGSYAIGLLLPVHPELINGNGNYGVSLGALSDMP